MISQVAAEARQVGTEISTKNGTHSHVEDSEVPTEQQTDIEHDADSGDRMDVDDDVPVVTPIPRDTGKKILVEDDSDLAAGENVQDQNVEKVFPHEEAHVQGEQADVAEL